MPNRVEIGGGSSYAATVDGIKAALDAGEKWLVIVEDEITWDKTLDLTPYAGRFIRVEGAGLNPTGVAGNGGTVLRRTFTSGPMVASINYSFQHLYFSGLTFVEGVAGSVSFPLVDIRYLDRSRFVRCGFIGSKWDGLSLSALTVPAFAQAATSEFEQCLFAGNARNGCAIGHGIDIGFNQCAFLNNGMDATTSANFAGLYYQGPAPGGNHPSERTRGLGTIKHCFFSKDHPAPALGAWIVHARVMDIVRCTFDRCDLRLHSTTSDGYVHRNRKTYNTAHLVNNSSDPDQNEHASVTLS